MTKPCENPTPLNLRGMDAGTGDPVQEAPKQKDSPQQTLETNTTAEGENDHG